MKEDKISVFIHKCLKLLHINVKKNTEKLFVQIFKFVIVGGVATVIDWLIYYLLFNFLKINPLVANILSFSISVVYNYLASVKWVFDVDQDKSKSKQFITFIVFSIIGLLINNLILWICIDKLSIYYLIGKVIATGIVMVFNFITRKMFLE